MTVNPASDATPDDLTVDTAKCKACGSPEDFNSHDERSRFYNHPFVSDVEGPIDG